MRTDGEIQEAVLRELRWDTRVPAAGVGVAVDRGVVTLSGTVGSVAARWAAQEAAHRVDGVLDVANDLEIHLPGDAVRTDAELARAVRWALEWDALVPHWRVQSTVARGWVTLDGAVDYAAEREDAERAVRHLAGISGVTNRIVVAGPPVAAEDIREEIAGVLSRRAAREAKHLAIEARDGTVTLRRPVHTGPERRALVAAVRFTPGVRDVVDHLRLDEQS